jgi:hypothetical protein
MYHYISLYTWTNWLKDVESEPNSSFSRSIPSIANLSVISCVFQGPGDFLTGANWNEYQKNKHHVLFPVGPACLQGSTSVFFLETPWIYFMHVISTIISSLDWLVGPRRNKTSWISHVEKQQISHEANHGTPVSNGQSTYPNLNANFVGALRLSQTTCKTIPLTTKKSYIYI